MLETEHCSGDISNNGATEKLVKLSEKLVKELSILLDIGVMRDNYNNYSVQSAWKVSRLRR